MTKEEILQKIKYYQSKYSLIKEQIYDCYTWIQELQELRSNENVQKKIKEIDKRTNQLKQEKNQIFEKLIYYEELLRNEKPEIVFYDDEIELGIHPKKIEGFYYIWLKSINKVIGYIDYSKNDYKLGNIAYEIYPDYRGNNYAYKALVLLSKYLKKQGIEDISLAIRETNTPSLKTAEKFIEKSKETIIKKNKGLNKNITMYYFKIGDEE